MKISIKYESASSSTNDRMAEVARDSSAFTLPEVLCAALLIVVAVCSIYLSMGQGRALTEENILNVRANQLVSEQMETIRLYTWTQLTNSGYIPTSFTNSYYPNGSTNISAGVTYSGTLTITNAPVTEGYSNDLRLVIVQVQWNPGSNWTTGFQHTLQVSTLVAHYGMQTYIYEPK